MPDDSDDQEEMSEPGRLRRMYEDEAKARADAESRLADLERREAFRDAGLDPQNPQHRAFIKAYDGEVTPERVTEYVAELGVTQPAAAPAPVSQEEQDSMQRIADASAGDGSPPPVTDREKQIRAEMEVAARRGDNASLDRLSSELSRVRGFQTLTDLQPT